MPHLHCPVPEMQDRRSFDLKKALLFQPSFPVEILPEPRAWCGECVARGLPKMYKVPFNRVRGGWGYIEWRVDLDPNPQKELESRGPTIALCHCTAGQGWALHIYPVSHPRKRLCMLAHLFLEVIP